MKDERAPDLNTPGFEPGTQWSEVECFTSRPNEPRPRLNETKVNRNKFQLIIFNTQMTENVLINADGCVIRNEPVVKIVVFIYIDALLNFRAHVNSICRKSRKRLNVLARLSGVLDVEFRLLLFYSFILSQLEHCAYVVNILTPLQRG